MFMAEVLNFFKDLEIWVYGILGIVGLLSLIKFMRAWNEMRQAAFGLELESAQQRLNSAATTLVLIVMFAIGEFTLVTFIIPYIPDASPIPSPTLDLLATQTITLAPMTATPLLTPTELNMLEQNTIMGLGTPAAPENGKSGCVAEQINITSPVDGSGVGGVVPIIGTADIPNFGFYKFEFSSPGQPNWLAIQAWTSSKREDTLGQWDTSRLTEGLYLLRLVVTDNQGKALPPCVIQVTVLKAPE